MKTNMIVACLAATAAAATFSPARGDVRPWLNAKLTPEQRAAALLANMTLDEKVHMLHASGEGYIGNVEGIDRLGVPALRLNDGPQGARREVVGSTSVLI